jgi:hypothetical protein
MRKDPTLNGLAGPVKFVNQRAQRPMHLAEVTLAGVVVRADSAGKKSAGRNDD